MFYLEHHEHPMGIDYKTVRAGLALEQEQNEKSKAGRQ